MFRLHSLISLLTISYYSTLLQQTSALAPSTQHLNPPSKPTLPYQTNKHSNLSLAATPPHLTIPRNPFTYEFEGHQALFSIASPPETYSPATARIFIQQVFQRQLTDRLAAGWPPSHELPGDGISLIGDGVEPPLWWYMNQELIQAPKMKLTYYHLEIALNGAKELVQAYGDELVMSYRFALFDLRVETDLLAIGELKLWLGGVGV